MFSKGSRYEKTGVYCPVDSRGETHQVKRTRRIPAVTGTLIHTVRETDRLDLLAYTYYKDPTKFWLICDANNVMHPSDLLVPGKKIIIPGSQV
ncbi:MAG: hypothetical protein LUQ07_08000 [Methanospirillum sp.]|nr:hypothetical protein [Methanospirillum sp.]